MKIVIVSIVIVVIIALVVCLVPLKEVAYTVMADYEDTETYYVTEYYTEAVPLSFEADGYVEEDLINEHRQIIIGGIVLQDEIVEVPIYIACVEVKNTDDVAGEFTVSFSGFEPMFGEFSLTKTLNLDPGQQETAECPAESVNDWDYEVAPGTKEVEMEREVEKQRTVIKQREETRYKKVPLLDYLLNY